MATKAKGKGSPNPHKTEAKGGKSKKMGTAVRDEQKAKAREEKVATGASASQAVEEPGASGAAEETTPKTKSSSKKRKLGLRGAAPWAARHAAKHAEEARIRAAEPPLPGSARASIRTPLGVEEIKAQIVQLHNDLERMKSLRKNLAKNFFDIGLLLGHIQEHKLYAAKGFQSFESFLEREVDLGKTVGLRLARVAIVFQKEAALEFGIDRIMEALQVLEGTTETGNRPPSNPPASPARPSDTGANKSPIVGR